MGQVRAAQCGNSQGTVCLCLCFSAAQGAGKVTEGNGNGFSGAFSLQCQPPQCSHPPLQIAFLLQTLQLHYFSICPVPVGFEQLAGAKELWGKIS